AVPSLYLLAHRIYPMPTLLFSNFVLSFHMLYGLALAVGNTLSAKLLQGASAALLALALLAFGRRYLSPGAGALAAVLALSMPLVGMNAASAGIDVAAAFLLFTAAFALARALTENNRPLLRAAGWLFGFAASSKVPAWGYLPLSLVLIALFSRRRCGGRAAFRHCLI